MLPEIYYIFTSTCPHCAGVILLVIRQRGTLLTYSVGVNVYETRCQQESVQLF